MAVNAPSSECWLEMKQTNSDKETQTYMLNK